MALGIASLVPELQPFAQQLVAVCAQAGLSPRITSCRRSSAEQKRLYEAYLAGNSMYPAAPPGTSAHEFGCAFDMVVSPLSALADVGAAWEQAGGVWGGRIGDDVHFELPNWKSFIKPDEAAGSSGGFGILPAPVRAKIYSLEDVLLGVSVPFVGAAELAGALLEAGWGPSDVTAVLQTPVSTLHRWFPWFPF